MVERQNSPWVVNKSSSKLLVEKSMLGPSNLDHPPAMELRGRSVASPPRDVIPKRLAIFRGFLFGRAGRIFRNGKQELTSSSKSPEGGTILVFGGGHLKFRPFCQFFRWFSFHFPSFFQLHTSNYKTNQKNQKHPLLLICKWFEML